jgi:hypothetical protein
LRSVSYSGLVLLARSANSLLVHVPQVRVAFGSRWGALEDLGDGWQLLELVPWSHEWPVVGAGPGDLAVATGEPALAAWISDTACVQLAGATPDGVTWTAHVADTEDDNCRFDHHRFALLRLPAGEDPTPTDLRGLAGKLLDWADAAGLDASPHRVGTVFSPPGSYYSGFRTLVAALGLPEQGREVSPLFDKFDPEWYSVVSLADMAGSRICRHWTAGPSPYDPEMPWEVDYLRFLEQLSTSMYGGGLNRQELGAEAARLQARWSPTIEAEHERRSAMFEQLEKQSQDQPG